MFGLQPHLDQKTANFTAKTCFFGIHLFLDGKRVTPCNPAPGVTIPSNASAPPFPVARLSMVNWSLAIHYQLVEAVATFPKELLDVVIGFDSRRHFQILMLVRSVITTSDYVFSFRLPCDYFVFCTLLVITLQYWIRCSIME